MGLIVHLKAQSGVTVIEHTLSTPYWEEGSIKLSRAMWPTATLLILEEYNRHQEWMYETALAAYESLKRSKPYGVAWQRAFQTDPFIRSLPHVLRKPVLDSIFHRYSPNICSPRKKDFPPVRTRRRPPETLTYVAGAELGLDRTGYLLRWSLRWETEAHGIYGIERLFELLSEIDYNWGTGGAIVTPHGTAGFGPIGAALTGKGK